MNILCVQHASFERPACIETWAVKRSHTFRSVHAYKGEPFPDVSTFDALVLMGGPMSVHDESRHAWLRQEKRFIERSIAGGKTVLGVCLGSQLLAEALGGVVVKNDEKEIGWFTVEKTPDAGRWPASAALPSPMTVFQWHGETFTLPAGSLHLMKSQACENQAFLCEGRLLGLQFHLELEPPDLRQLVAHCRDELVPGRWIQSEHAILAGSELCGEANAYIESILDSLLTADRPSRG